MKKRYLAVFLTMVLLLFSCMPALAITSGKDDSTVSIYSMPFMEADAVPVAMKVSKLPNQTSYRVGDAFCGDGTELLLEYSDGGQETVTYGYTFTGFDSITAGPKTVTVHYNDLIDTIRVYVAEISNEPTEPDALQWTLRYFDDKGNSIRYVPEGGTFWISVGLKNYHNIIGNMSSAESGDSPIIYDHTLDAYLAVFHFDNNKITPVEGSDSIINLYDHIDFSGDAFVDNGRFVYMAAADEQDIGCSLLDANDGELFRVRFMNISSEVEEEASVSFVSFDGARCSLTCVDKAAGQVLDVSCFATQPVYGYDTSYTLTLGVADALKIVGAGLTLQNDLAMDFYVKKSTFSEGGYSNPLIHFAFGDTEYNVTNYREKGVYYIFRFDDISPDMMTQLLTARVSATDSTGHVTYGPLLSYSVGHYAANTLARYSDDEYAALKTLVVDMLRYGTAAQMYAGSALPAADGALTSEQSAWGTDTNLPLTLTDYLNLEQQTIENPTVSFTGAQLDLQKAVNIQFLFKTDDVTDLTFTVQNSDNQIYTYTAEDLTVLGDGYCLIYDKLDAGQMRTLVYVTAYRDGVAVSHTLQYNIESYAAAKLAEGTDAPLCELLSAMMRYGDSAALYKTLL